ncbi:MAG: DNA methyltransferase, partial [Chloroflexi bacterium]|nr:DNA methyltransferase [Chloroflexota bacterium]
IVIKHSKPGDLIVDPFLGSGTTAIAALQEGRIFKGCDIDDKYVEAAKERVRRNAQENKSSAVSRPSST